MTPENCFSLNKLLERYSILIVDSNDCGDMARGISKEEEIELNKLKIKIEQTLKLRELVKERIKQPSEETCFGIPIDSGIRSELQSLLKDSMK